MNIEKSDYTEYLKKLSKAADVEIQNFQDLKNAIRKRLEYFKCMGCCISDHGLDFMVYVPAEDEEIERIFSARLHNKNISAKDGQSLKQHVCFFWQKNMKN